MSDFRVCRDEHSGALVIEKDYSAEGRIGVEINMVFKPRGLWRQLVFLLGLNFPGPVILEVQTGGNILNSECQRRFGKLSVEERLYSIVQKGDVTVRAMMNPEDFYHRWQVSIRIRELNN